MNINSYMPVKLITGAGCVRASAKEIGKLGACCLLVTGRHAAKACGAFQDVSETLELNGQRWVLYDAIGQNPRLTNCMEAAELARQAGADFVIGIGGGSALDAAKCIAVLAANPGMTQEQLYAFDWSSPPLAIAAVGTTAGTGSEVTKVSVITTPDGRKRSFHHEAVYPKLSLGDPCYTMTLSEQTSCSTMVDVLAHSANHISRCYAVEGIRLLLPVFRHIAVNGAEKLSYEQREALYCASIYGGLAINITGTCFPHTMGYLLTEQWEIAHGTACALFQNEFYKYNKKVVPELAAEFLHRTGCGEEEYLSLIEKLTPHCDISISEQDVTAAHSRWINNASMAKCQGVFSPEMADDVLRRLFCDKP